MTEGSAKARGALEVILFEDTRFVGSLMFTSPEVTIGSDSGVMVRLEDVDVAPRHAVLHFDGDSCRIEDCGSALGTEVNGVAVASQSIRGMDEISIGRYRLRITLHKPDVARAPVSARPVAKPAGAVSPRPSPSPARPVAPPSLAAASPPPRPAPPVPPVVPVRASGQTRAIWPPPVPSPPAATVPRSAIPRTASPPAAREAPASSARPVAGTAPVAHAARPTSSAPGAAPSAPAMATVRAPLPQVAIVPASKPFLVTGEPPAPKAPPPARAWPDDDDDDEVAFEPTFSLLDGLCEVGLTSASTEHAVEVIRFRHGCVTKLRHLRGGERLRLPGLRKAVGQSPRRGSFAFFRDALPESAAVSEAGQPVDEAEWRRRADKRGQVPLNPRTQVIFPLPTGEGVLVHLVPAASSLPRAPLRLKLSKPMLWIGGLSLLVHLVVFAVIGLTSLVRREYIVDSKEGRFARIALKEVELEPPVAPPASEKKKAKPERSENAPSETAPRVAVAHIPRARTIPSAPAPATVTAQKLLSALGSMAAAPKTSMATAMSNLDAVAPVRGGGFKVSGAIGKLPGDSLRLASAGSGIGRFDTKSASDVGKDLGRVLGRAPTGQVRAQVTAKPNTMKVEGHLDRGEIQRVINSHIFELQGCYERQLIVSPNLSGKVTFEWVIGSGGSVTSVKIKASTLSSNEATSCMQAAVRRWQFPSPSGGSVTVIYPIALATSGS
jgi:hypothetical protein